MDTPPRRIEIIFGDEDTPLELRRFQDAFSLWEKTLESFGFQPQQLFRHIELVDPERAEHFEPIITWLPVTEHAAIKHRLQRSIADGKFSRTLEQLEGRRFSKGVRITAPYLWEVRQDPELIAAVLLEASLFARLGSRKARYPSDHWPPIQHVIEDRDSIGCILEERVPGFEGWPPLCTTVLPVRCEDWWYKVDDISVLWRLLAEEHARLYSQYLVVCIGFVESERSGRLSDVSG